MSHAMTDRSQAIADPYRFRVAMATAELEQAIDFDAGRRDDTFGECQPDMLPLRRLGAAMGCVRAAMQWLNQRPPDFTTDSPTLTDLRWRHAYQCCGEQCPYCIRGEEDL